MKRQI